MDCQVENQSENQIENQSENQSEGSIEVRPALKSGVKFWRARFSGELRVGTRFRNIPIPDQVAGISTQTLLTKFDGGNSLTKITGLASSVAAGFSLDDLVRLVSKLKGANLIDLKKEKIRENLTLARRLSNPSDGESIDSFSIRDQQRKIESGAVTFRESCFDGGGSEIERRSKFKILIFNTNRLAIHLLGALKSAGFDQIAVIDRSPRGHRSRLVQAEDLTGGFFRGNEILHLKEPLIDQLISGISGPKIKISEPDLIISVGSPPFDAEQRWMSEGVKHLLIDYENSAEIRIGPLVTPGSSPCLSCIENSEIELGLDLPQRQWVKDFELSATLALLAAGLISSSVAEFADRGTNKLIGRTIDISAASYLEPALKSWRIHPECGCSS